MAEPLHKKGADDIKTQLFQTEEALNLSRAEYRTIFNESPISIWEEDFSVARNYVNQRRAEGTRDIRGYLARHPEDVAKLAKSVRIKDINDATLQIYEAGSREELESNLPHVFGPATYGAFLEEISAFAEGQTEFTAKTTNKTLGGKEMIVSLKLSLVPGCENDWSRVLVFINPQINN